MPSPEELVQAVKEMRAQGLTDDEIRETLADMGVPEDVISKLLSGQAVQIPEEQPVVSSSPEPAEQPASEPVSTAKDEDDLLFKPSPPAEDVLSKIPVHSGSETTSRSSSSPPEIQSSTESQTMDSRPSISDDFDVGIATPPILKDESDSKLEEIHSKVDELHRTLSSAPLRDDIAELKEMVRELRKEVRQVQAMFGAIQKILQEILETDRSILVDLYERTKK